MIQIRFLSLHKAYIHICSHLGGDVLHGLHGVLRGNETSSHNVLNLKSTLVSVYIRRFQHHLYRVSLTYFHKLEEASVDALALSGGQI